jgi:hypothetical protein
MALSREGSQTVSNDFNMTKSCVFDVLILLPGMRPQACVQFCCNSHLLTETEWSAEHFTEPSKFVCQRTVYEYQRAVGRSLPAYACPGRAGI